jgi:hypothetical protein
MLLIAAQVAFRDLMTRWILLQRIYHVRMVRYDWLELSFDDGTSR